MLQLGVIGAGRIGKIHTENLLRMRGVNCLSVADPYPDHDWAASAGVNITNSPDDLLSDNRLQAIVICSPSNEHADQIIAAARAGKHIFCEKPIALDPTVIRSALAEVKRAGVKFQLGFNRRFDPNFARIRASVQEGEIGEPQIIRITSRDPEPPPPEYIKNSGGMFLDMTIHDFDMLRFLSGSEPTEIYAAGSALVDPAIAELGDIDTAILTVRLQSGALGVIDNCRQAAYGYDQRVEVFGSKGSISANNNTQTNTTLCTAQGVRSEKPMYFFLERYRESYRAELEAFVAAVGEDRDPAVGGVDGLVSVLMGLAAQASLREGRMVAVESVS